MPVSNDMSVAHAASTNTDVFFLCCLCDTDRTTRLDTDTDTRIRPQAHRHHRHTGTTDTDTSMRPQTTRHTTLAIDTTDTSGFKKHQSFVPLRLRHDHSHLTTHLSSRHLTEDDVRAPPGEVTASVTGATAATAPQHCPTVSVACHQ